MPLALLQLANEIGGYVGGRSQVILRHQRVLAESPNPLAYGRLNADVVHARHQNPLRLAALPISSLTHHGEVHAVAFSPDGIWVATASDDGTAQVVTSTGIEQT